MNMVRIMTLALVVSLAGCDDLIDPADEGALSPDEFVFMSSADAGLYHDILVFHSDSTAQNLTNTP
jgi:hypothetical protein